jgi:hypothetical protein
MDPIGMVMSIRPRLLAALVTVIGMLLSSSVLPVDGWPATPVAEAFSLDTTPPIGSVDITVHPPTPRPGMIGPIRVVALTATDNVTPLAQIQMRLANTSDFAGAVWQPFAAEVTWDFAGGRVVYAQFRDEAANVSAVYSQSLLVATSPCTPRQPVRITAQRTNGALAVTVSTTGTDNGVRGVRFESFNNAIVDVGSQQNQSAPFSVTIPAGQQPTSIPFTLRRQTAGRATMVRLVVTDACGEWSTFVGGGPAAF